MGSEPCETGSRILGSFERTGQRWPPLTTCGDTKPEVATVEGRVGKAASFDGKAVVEPAAISASFDIEDRFTLSAWIYSDTVPDGSIMSRMADNPKGGDTVSMPTRARSTSTSPASMPTTRSGSKRSRRSSRSVGITSPSLIPGLAWRKVSPF